MSVTYLQVERYDCTFIRVAERGAECSMLRTTPHRTLTSHSCLLKLCHSSADTAQLFCSLNICKKRCVLKT